LDKYSICIELRFPKGSNGEKALIFILQNIKVDIRFIKHGVNCSPREATFLIRPLFHCRKGGFIRVGEWLLFNANSAIFQLYHGENKLIFNERMMRYALY
jgi:hypothetical protein